MFESTATRLSLLLLRLSVGWLMFYAGITKVLNPAWSAGGYLTNAKMFPEFFAWFARPEILPFTNYFNEWGLTLLGVSLILGICVRLSSVLGIGLMALYYLALSFPYPNPNSFVVDEHIIYICVLLFFAIVRAGRVFGLENWCSSLPLCSRFPRIRKILG